MHEATRYREQLPHRRLVDTGGIPLLLIAGGVLVASGLLIVRKMLR